MVVVVVVAVSKERQIIGRREAKERGTIGGAEQRGGCHQLGGNEEKACCTRAFVCILTPLSQ